MINYEQKIVDTSPEIGDGLVISIPLSLNDDFLSLLDKYPSLKIFQFKTLLKMLISKAVSEVLIASPFIEENGIMYIMDDITNAAKNGVSIKILSRDIVKADPNDYSSLNKQRAISKLKELYEVNKASPNANISIRDFGVSISSQGRKSLHYEGIHQKMVVVDRQYSYIGSGEIRTASFITNGEAGSIYTGLSAEFWADFFEIFWKRATDVLSNLRI